MDTIREFKAGDKVSDLRHGNGIVEAINSNSYCPVFVLFPSKRTEVYMADGRERESDLTPMLYHGHDIIFEAREPERFYVNLYWGDQTKKTVECGFLYSSKKEAQAHPRTNLPRFVKTVVILK